MNKKIIIVIVVVVCLGLGVFAAKKVFSGPVLPPASPTPAPPMAEQLSEDKYPRVSLLFSPDGHYVTVNISDINAVALEYNLVYDCLVKNKPVNTGVTGSAKLDGGDSYSYRQLLGSESSGKFTYHEDIKNAVMELTLRDENRYSIFSAIYPFEVISGKSVDLTPAE